MDNSIILLIINAIVYFITLFVHLKRCRYRVKPGFVLFLVYLGSAVTAIFLYTSPGLENFYPAIKLFPFIYLYAMLMLMFIPIFKVDESHISSIVPPDRVLLHTFFWIIIICSLWNLQAVAVKFRTSFTEMLMNNAFSGNDDFDLSAQGRGGLNILSIFRNMVIGFAAPMLMYYLTLKRRSTVVTIGLLAAAILQPLSSLSMGARGETVKVVVMIIVCALFFGPFMTRRIRKWMYAVMGTVVGFLVITFLLVTNVKFGQAYTDENVVHMSTLSYYGQPFINFNNYGLDADGIRNGDRTAQLVKMVIDPSTPRNYSERLIKYSKMKMNESYFYTFVGDFTLDYGPLAAFLIFVFFFFFFNKHLSRIRGDVPFYRIIPLLFLMELLAGGFPLYPFAGFGNLRIISYIILYFVFWMNYSKHKADRIGK